MRSLLGLSRLLSVELRQKQCVRYVAQRRWQSKTTEVVRRAVNKTYFERIEKLTFQKKLKSADPTKEIDLTTIPAERIRNFSIIAHIGMCQCLHVIWCIPYPSSIHNNQISTADHGKSTLADRYKVYRMNCLSTETQHWNNPPISSTRLLELTKTIRDQGSNKQVLDKLKVERERGITVKAQVMIQWGFQMIHGCRVIILTKMYLDCVNVLHVQRAEIPFEPDWYSGKISKCEMLYQNALSWLLKRGLGACGL